MEQGYGASLGGGLSQDSGIESYSTLTLQLGLVGPYLLLVMDNSATSRKAIPA